MLATKRLTAFEYFDLDARHEGKLELWHGHPVAMAGASPRHNIIAANLLGNLWQQTRQRGCNTFPSDQRVGLPDGHYAYPDLSVACGPYYDEARPASLLNPALLVEIVSDSTAQTDRRDKLDAYTRLASVQGYWLIEQDRVFATCYTRQGEAWVVQTLHDPADELACAPLGLLLALADVYRDVPLDGERA